jgi:hypothetical protein
VDSPVEPDSKIYCIKNRLAMFDFITDSSGIKGNEYFIAGSLVSKDSVPIYGITVKCQFYNGASNFMSGKELDTKYADMGKPVDSEDIFKGINAQDTLHPKETLRWLIVENVNKTLQDTIYELTSATIPYIEYWERIK